MFAVRCSLYTCIRVLFRYLFEHKNRISLKFYWIPEQYSKVVIFTGKLCASKSFRFFVVVVVELRKRWATLPLILLLIRCAHWILPHVAINRDIEFCWWLSWVKRSLTKGLFAFKLIWNYKVIYIKYIVNILNSLNCWKILKLVWKCIKLLKLACSNGVVSIQSTVPWTFRATNR